MPSQPTITEIRLKNITKCLSVNAETLGMLASSAKAPFLEAISNTTQSLLKNIPVNFNLEAVFAMGLRTLHKIHTFVEAQQSGSKFKMFFRQGEVSRTVKQDCNKALISFNNLLKDIWIAQKNRFHNSHHTDAR
ncbi:hypothetical protein B0H19DRAFT_1083016 [Mycena capillaripes]|nr:hypothetical protein B0H19DRAFT_1083016 [Mycena capillaripes]